MKLGPTGSESRMPRNTTPGYTTEPNRWRWEILLGIYGNLYGYRLPAGFGLRMCEAEERHMCLDLYSSMKFYGLPI